MNDFDAHSEKGNMYGNISHIEFQPMQMGTVEMAELGHEGAGLPTNSAVMRYAAGCVKRERERLARIFILQKSPQAIAEAILDCSMDDHVFKWNGPEVGLDAPPKSAAQRRIEKMSRSDDE